MVVVTSRESAAYLREVRRKAVAKNSARTERARNRSLADETSGRSFEAVSYDGRREYRDSTPPPCERVHEVRVRNHRGAWGRRRRVAGAIFVAFVCVCPLVCILIAMHSGRKNEKNKSIFD